MPEYDYRCMECKEVYTVRKAMDDPHPEVCGCGGDLKMLFAKAPRVHYKGSGFYCNDVALDTPVPGYDGPDEDGSFGD
jgi:putative FmdB family regulatory protein